MNAAMRLCLTACTILLTQCAMPLNKIYKYDLSLTGVQKSTDSTEIADTSSIRQFKDSTTTKYAYSDSAIEIIFWMEETQFQLLLKNKTGSSVKIDWDSVVYVNPVGNRLRVLHSGVSFFNKLDPQSPTTVAKKSELADFILPADNVQYDNFNKGWKIATLLGSSDGGKNIQIVFPVEIEGIVKPYTFKFMVNAVTVEEQRIRL